MKDRAAVLIDEIQQITTQYKAEFPGRRHAWPKAIKERVQALFALGLKPKVITERTGLSYHTVVYWSSQAKQKQTFHPVKVVTAKSGRHPVPVAKDSVATVTVKRRGRSSSSKSQCFSVDAIVTVTTPQGFIIEGLPRILVGRPRNSYFLLPRSMSSTYGCLILIARPDGTSLISSLIVPSVDCWH